MMRHLLRRGVNVMVLVVIALGTEACARAQEQTETAPTLSLDRQSFTLTVGDTTTLNLIAGAPAVTVGGVRWRSQDPTIIEVSSEDGFITARAPGATRVWASFGQDSVSAIAIVEAPQALFVHEPQSFQSDAVGDEFVIELVSIGREPLPNADLSQFCASDDPSVVTVGDSLVVTTRGNGSTYVRCTIGETSDSTAVTVEQRAVRVAIVASSLRPLGLTDDSLLITLARVDRLGNPIPDARPTWTSLNDRIVRVDEFGFVRAVSLGLAPIVGEVHGIADTIPLEVVAAYAEDLGPTLPALAFVDPSGPDATDPEAVARTITADSAALDTEDQRERIASLIIATQPQRASAQSSGGTFAVAVRALAAFVDHRADIGFGAERTSGPVFGAELGVRFGRFGLRAHGYAGKLSAGTGATEDRDILDVRAVASFTTLPWLDLEVGANFRRYTTVFNEEQWASVAVGGVGHLDALDGAFRGAVGFHVLPATNVTTLAQSPNLGIIGSAEMSYRFSRFTASVRYEMERFTFPQSNGFQRVEQFSILALRLGVLLGGAPPPPIRRR